MEDYGYWCFRCRTTMDDVDKWYLIGFLGLTDQANPNGMIDIRKEGAAFSMGCKDRMGDGTDQSVHS